jgi:hypothetical protein
MSDDASYLSKPKTKPKSKEEVKKVPPPKAAPKPLAPKPLAAKPVVAKPLPKPSGERKGFFAKLKTAWNPPPRKTPLPVTPAIPKTVEKPKEPIIPVTPAPVAKPAPVARKPAPAPKPKKIREPRAPIDHLALWPPWALALAAVSCSAFRDFGFEGVPALLWGLAGWAIGFMVRLSRLYPFQPFEESTLNELLEKKGRVLPVLLKGQIVLVDENAPKGPLLFKQEAKTLALNRIGAMDMIPRLFGLSNPRQLPKGEVTLRGWFRPGPVPFLEIQEVRADKATRKSTVRGLRWGFAVALLVLSVVISLALD